MLLLKNSLKSLIKLPPQALLCVLALTASSYMLIDLFPIQSVGPFKNYEARIVTSLWQSLVWGLYSMGLSFFILYCLGQKKGLVQIHFLHFVRRNILEYITAQLRIVILSSLWFLLLIIPGIVMFIRYSLSNAFIFFHPHFHEDRSLDPIRLSKNSIGFKKIGFMFIYFLCAFMAPFIVDSIFEHAHFMFEPQGRFVQIFFYSFLYLFINALIFNTYLDVREENYV